MNHYEKEGEFWWHTIEYCNNCHEKTNHLKWYKKKDGSFVSIECLQCKEVFS